MLSWQPSLKQVAERAGVSVRTVSNVVYGFALVAPETRARVQRALDELDYRPNAAARHLRGGRSGLIGLVLPEISSPYFAELAGHLVEEAEARSWMVLVQQTDGDAERERWLPGGVRGQTVDGLVMSPWALSPADLRRSPDAHRWCFSASRTPAGCSTTWRWTAWWPPGTRSGTWPLSAAPASPRWARSRNCATARLPGAWRDTGRAGRGRAAVRPGAGGAGGRLHRPDGAARCTGCWTPEPRWTRFSASATSSRWARCTRRPGAWPQVPRRCRGGRLRRHRGRPVRRSGPDHHLPDKPAIARAALSLLADRLRREPYTGPARQIVIAHTLEVRTSTAGS